MLQFYKRIHLVNPHAAHENTQLFWRSHHPHLIEQGLVIGSFTGVHVYPAAERSREVLHPDVVCQVQDVSRVEADCAATQRKAVGPLPAAPFPALQQPPGVVVPWEPALAGI